MALDSFIVWDGWGFAPARLPGVKNRFSTPCKRADASPQEEGLQMGELMTMLTMPWIFELAASLHDSEVLEQSLAAFACDLFVELLGPR